MPWAWRMRTAHEPDPHWRDKLFIGEVIPASAERHPHNYLTIVWWDE